MGDSVPALSVIIVSYNTRQMTLDCLETLLGDLAADGELSGSEVWVVDNGSEDGSVEAIRSRFAQVRVIANTNNRGFGAANNQALQEASGEFVLLLNSDAFPHSGAIRALIDRLRTEPVAAVVGPRLLNTDGTLQLSCYRFPGPWRAFCENLLLTAKWPDHRLVGDYRAWAHDGDREVEFVIGACLMARRLALAQVGFFDESYFLYAEEADLCRRLHTAGWKIVFTPAANVTHLNGGSGRRQPDRVFCEFRRGQERFVRKHYGVIGLGFYRTMLMIGASLRIGLFAIAAMLRPAQSAEKLKQIAEWRRILTWTVGFRGPGLSDR
jgi:GT2 family glycosyltransferase